MTTQEMLKFMQSQGYSVSLIARQTGLNYFRLHRHACNGKGITDDEKATVWRFCLCQPVLQEEMWEVANSDMMDECGIGYPDTHKPNIFEEVFNDIFGRK